MSPRLLGLALAAVIAAAALPAEAGAAKRRFPPGHTIYASHDLWATIDVCDSAAHPHTVGVRGSMPGSGIAREQMFMSFALEYRDANGAWVALGAHAASGFVAVGASVYQARQAGTNFALTVAPGMVYLVRGVVHYEWRRGGHVVRHASKVTDAGHVARSGSDPPGYSAAVCELS